MKRNIFCAVILIMAVSPLFNVLLAQESVRRILRNGSNNTNIVIVTQKGCALPLSKKPSRPDAGRPVQAGQLPGEPGSVLPLPFLKGKMVSESEFKENYEPHGWRHNADGTVEAPPGWPVDVYGFHKPIEPVSTKWNVSHGVFVSYVSKDKPGDYELNQAININVSKESATESLRLFPQKSNVLMFSIRGGAIGLEAYKKEKETNGIWRDRLTCCMQVKLEGALYKGDKISGLGGRAFSLFPEKQYFHNPGIIEGFAKQDWDKTYTNGNDAYHELSYSSAHGYLGDFVVHFSELGPPQRELTLSIKPEVPGAPKFNIKFIIKGGQEVINGKLGDPLITYGGGDWKNKKVIKTDLTITPAKKDIIYTRDPKTRKSYVDFALEIKGYNPIPDEARMDSTEVVLKGGLTAESPYKKSKGLYVRRNSNGHIIFAGEVMPHSRIELSHSKNVMVWILLPGEISSRLDRPGYELMGWGVRGVEELPGGKLVYTGWTPSHMHEAFYRDLVRITSGRMYLKQGTYILRIQRIGPGPPLYPNILGEWSVNITADGGKEGGKATAVASGMLRDEFVEEAEAAIRESAGKPTGKLTQADYAIHNLTREIDFWVDFVQQLRVGKAQFGGFLSYEGFKVKLTALEKKLAFLRQKKTDEKYKSKLDALERKLAELKRAQPDGKIKGINP